MTKNNGSVLFWRTSGVKTKYVSVFWLGKILLILLKTKKNSIS